VPESVLRANPFNLAWGASIYVKVTAVNVKGTSPESAEGNGAVILTVPDAPVDLADSPTVTKAT
jgi:hypothetical protein